MLQRNDAFVARRPFRLRISLVFIQRFTNRRHWASFVIESLRYGLDRTRAIHLDLCSRLSVIERVIGQIRRYHERQINWVDLVDAELRLGTVYKP